MSGSVAVRARNVLRGMSDPELGGTRASHGTSVSSLPLMTRGSRERSTSSFSPPPQELEVCTEATMDAASLAENCINLRLERMPFRVMSPSKVSAVVVNRKVAKARSAGGRVREDAASHSERSCSTERWKKSEALFSVSLAGTRSNSLGRESHIDSSCCDWSGGGSCVSGADATSAGRKGGIRA